MALSARNHLKGEVTEVVLGTVTALITVKVGDNLVESVITKHSAEEMKLKKRRQGHRGYKGDRSDDSERLRCDSRSRALCDARASSCSWRAR